jgi:hypothetical protein
MLNVIPTSTNPTILLRHPGNRRMTYMFVGMKHIRRSEQRNATHDATVDANQRTCCESMQRVTS